MKKFLLISVFVVLPVFSMDQGTQYTPEQLRPILAESVQLYTNGSCGAKAAKKAKLAKKALKQAIKAAKWENWAKETAAIHFSVADLQQLTITAQTGAESVRQYQDGSYGPKAAKKANKATKWATKAMTATQGQMHYGVPAIVFFEKKATAKVRGAQKAAAKWTAKNAATATR